MNEIICSLCDRAIHHNETAVGGRHKKCVEQVDLRQRAAEARERALAAIEALPDEQQMKVYACCEQLRVLCKTYGLDVRYALSLTSAEIGAGLIPLNEPGPQIATPDRKIITLNS